MRVVEQNQKSADTPFVRRTVMNFLDKVYYQMRNLGQTSQDRALNYAATNVFNLTNDLSQGICQARRSRRMASQISTRLTR